MEVALINGNFTPKLSLREVTAAFFKERTPESSKVMFWKLFQCWALKDCKVKADVSDEDVALFFDQLIDLVAAAYILHEANRVSENSQEGHENA